MKKIFLASILALSASTSFAAASNGFYLGVQGAAVTVEEETSGLDADVTALGVVGGYSFNENFAVEGRYLTGATSDTVSGVKTELDNYVGVNVVGKLPIEQGFSIYGMLGYGRAEVTASAQGNFVRASDSSPAYGVGVQWTQGNYSVRVGYESFYSKDDLSAKGAVFTVSRHF